MTYKKGDGIRVTTDAMGYFAHHKGRRGEVLLNGLQMAPSHRGLVIGFADTSERLTFGYAVRLFADEALNRTEDNLTIPATCLEAC